MIESGQTWIVFALQRVKLRTSDHYHLRTDQNSLPKLKITHR